MEIESKPDKMHFTRQHFLHKFGDGSLQNGVKSH